MTISKAALLRALEMVKNGSFLKDAAREIGCNPDVLSKKLRALGADTRQGSFGNRKRVPLEKQKAGQRQRQAQWAENNRKKIRAQHKRWRDANPEKHAASLQHWRERNPEKVRAQAQRYYDQDKAFAKLANTRAKRVGAPGTIVASDIKLIYLQQRQTCASCPADLSDGYIIDHKVPLSQHGINEPTNIQLLCPKCDKIKTAGENTKAARVRRTSAKI